MYAEDEINFKIEYTNFCKTHCVDSIKLTQHPNRIIEMATPTQDLQQLHLSLYKDLLRIYGMCLICERHHEYSLLWNMNTVLVYLNRVELCLVHLISFQYYKFHFKYYKKLKEYRKLYNKCVKKVKKYYREYRKEFSKLEKKFSKFYSKITVESKKNRVYTVNMNTVYSELVEHTKCKNIVSNPVNISELIETVEPVRMRPQEEEDTEKELLKRKVFKGNTN